MNNEIEIKILNIDSIKIRATLLKSKAKKIKTVFQINHIYASDYTKNKHVTVRLREEGKTCWLAIKSPSKIIRNHKIRREYEIVMPSYKDGHEMLTLQGYKQEYLVEIKREYFSLFSCSVEIMFVPKIPPFIEIEGSEKNILKVAKILGYSDKDYRTESIFKLYNLKRGSLKFKK